eukprot:COSAG01_NODE_8402_length_2796_cov_5.331850_2_plen_135_part_00
MPSPSRKQQQQLQRQPVWLPPSVAGYTFHGATPSQQRLTTAQVVAGGTAAAQLGRRRLLVRGVRSWRHCWLGAVHHCDTDGAGALQAAGTMPARGDVLCRQRRLHTSSRKSGGGVRAVPYALACLWFARLVARL